jgi:hypothetical protein
MINDEWNSRPNFLTGWSIQSLRSIARAIVRRVFPDPISTNKLLTYSQLKKTKNKKLRKFYENQNERLDGWLEVNAIVKALSDDILESFDPRDHDGDGIAEGGGALQDTGGRVEPFLPDEEQEKRRVGRRNAKWAININVIANVLLLIAKGIAAGYSSSLSLIASLVDSALDLLCTAIVFTTHKLVEWHLHKLRKKFPVGRRRLEPLGILVFSIIMIISFVQILKESVEKLMSKGPHEATALPPIAIGALAATIGLKGIIWFGCIRIKTTQVQALAQGMFSLQFLCACWCQSLTFPQIAKQTSCSTLSRSYFQLSDMPRMSGGWILLELDFYPSSSSTIGLRHVLRMSSV